MNGRQIIKIGEDKGWLRLRWTFQGKRYALTLGLPDSKTNRVVASRRANEIEIDIISGHFDPSLNKYRSNWQKVETMQKTRVFLSGAVAQFVQYKCDRVDVRTKERYGLFQRQFVEFFGDIDLLLFSQVECERYTKELFSNLSHSTASEKVTIAKSFFDWAIKNDHATLNVFSDLPIPRRPQKESAKPFSQSEVKTIISAFETNRYYAWYYPFVSVLFGTGMRLGEVSGLKWSKISSDRTQIEVSQSYSDNRMKPTKNNRSRIFRVSASVTKILESMPVTDGFVFQSAKGNPIDLRNYRNRAWAAIMKQTGIEYLKPYITRSTFISHALASGMHPLMVAQITGHDPETMFANYAGFINSIPTTPDLF